MIKAVFIDVDDTLLDFGACAKEAMKETMSEFDMVFEEGMFPVFARVNEELWLAIERGELTREGLWQVRWNKIFAELGIEADGLAFEWKFHDRLARSAVAVDGAKELLEYLAERYPVCVTTNAPHRQQIIRLTSAGMIGSIRHVFTSEKIGVSKPAPAFFEACFKELGDTFPQETIIIGDSLTADIRGGAAFGMKTCWYDPHGKVRPEDIRPDYIVKSLSEIKNIL